MWEKKNKFHKLMKQFINFRYKSNTPGTLVHICVYKYIILHVNTLKTFTCQYFLIYLKYLLAFRLRADEKMPKQIPVRNFYLVSILSHFSFIHSCGALSTATEIHNMWDKKVSSVI